ncbi:MAG: hypothetical protein I8H70_00675 [Burkholderiales bacterium]|nr:hypothetical protein [Burkholderiales bacterium]
MTAQRARHFNPNIGTPAQIFDLSLSFGDNAAPRRPQQVLNRTFELILRLRGHLGCKGFMQIIGEFLGGGLERSQWGYRVGHGQVNRVGVLRKTPCACKA